MWEMVSDDFHGFEIWGYVTRQAGKADVDLYSFVGLYRLPSAVYDDFQSFRPRLKTRFSTHLEAIHACHVMGMGVIRKGRLQNASLR